MAAEREDALERLMAKALHMVLTRPYARAELARRLTAKGAPEHHVTAVADRLERAGLINDAQYARALVERYSGKGYGVLKIRDELCRRGVPRAHWADALAGAEDPADRLDTLVRSRLEGRDPDRKELKRVFDALARRGYPWQDISAALRRYGTELDEE